MFKECNEIDDPQAENIMKELGVTWNVEVIDMKKIDWQMTMQNHGRVNNLRPEQYAKLLADKRRGDQFPRCVFAKQNNGKYVVLSGCNRTKADKEIGAAKCTAYIVTFDALTCQAIAIRTNSIHGHGLSVQEQLRLAVDMVDGHGLTIRDVARIMGLDEDQLTRSCTIVRTNTNLLAHGTAQHVLTAICDTTKTLLNKLRAKPTVMRAAAEFIASYKIGQDEAKLITTELANTESIEACLEKIKAAAANRKSIKSVRRRTTPACVVAVKTLAAMTHHQVASLLPADKEILRSLLLKASDALQTLQRELS